MGAATLATAWGVEVVEGLGTEVLGLAEAMADGEAVLPQPQLFMLSHDGVDQPLVLAPERQPLAPLITTPSPKTPMTVHRESVTRILVILHWSQAIHSPGDFVRSTAWVTRGTAQRCL